MYYPVTYVGKTGKFTKNVIWVGKTLWDGKRRMIDAMKSALNPYTTSNIQQISLFAINKTFSFFRYTILVLNGKFE